MVVPVRPMHASYRFRCKKDFALWGDLAPSSRAHTGIPNVEAILPGPAE